MNTRFLTAILVVLPFLLFGFAVGISMALPSAMLQWKAQRICEAPLAWQIGLDLSDFLIHRWLFWLPAYVAIAVTIRSRLR